MTDGWRTTEHRWRTGVNEALCFIHTCPSSMFRSPLSSSVISRPFQSLSFTPIRLSRAVDTDFCVPTVLSRYSPEKWLTEGLFLGEFPIHSSLPWFMVRIRHPSSVKIAPGPILTDDGWQTTDDGLGVNNLSYFLSERFWSKRTTDDWSGRRMVWRAGVNGAIIMVMSCR